MTGNLGTPAADTPPWQDDEWLQADGFGGFASGTVGGPRTRRYHALLLSATRPPTGRVVLVNGIEAWIETPQQRIALTSQRYAPGVVSPAAVAPCLDFVTKPWPTWRLQLDDQAVLTAECFVVKTSGQTVLRWQLDQAVEGTGGTAARAMVLKVRPLLSGRDYHALHHENPEFHFAARVLANRVRWRPYDALPEIVAYTNGTYAHEPDWYRNFIYERESERGLDDVEDLATPGVFSFDLGQGPAVMLLSASAGGHTEEQIDDAAVYAAGLADAERSRRAAFEGRLQVAADTYLVSRNEGLTLLAGFPWFTDWGRDTFISLRGLLLATGRWSEAGAILLEWCAFLSQGMLPNRFPDDGGAPEYNAVDASLWFVIAAHDYFESGQVTRTDRARLQVAVDTILQGYAQGTRYGIAADTDGLLRAGVPGMQLTWMDAKTGGRVVTPRIGKPVEVQALWINALRIAAAWDARWDDMQALATRSFLARFIDPGGGLYDVVDVDHQPGSIDGKIRPNQIFAVGGLPHALLEGQAARSVVEQVQRHLLTPLGLRTLSPSDPAYIGRYSGSPARRDAAYHQGTVWPWLMGPFVQAWLRIHGNGAAAREEARMRFLAPLRAQLDHAGRDHISEVADGDAPHRCGGAPFQAWSLGELLRIEQWLSDAL